MGNGLSQLSSSRENAVVASRLAGRGCGTSRYGRDGRVAATEIESRNLSSARSKSPVITNVIFSFGTGASIASLRSRPWNRF